MKRVLFITYYFPPAGGSGVQRSLKFVKYLRQFGWEPVVYTVSNGEFPELDPSLEKEVPAGVEVIRRPIWEPYSLYKKFTGQKSQNKINPNFFNQQHKGIKARLSIWLRSNFFIPDARMFWVSPSVGYLKKYLETHHIDAIISSGPPHSLHLIALNLKKSVGLPWLADFRDPWTNIDYYKNLLLTRRGDARHHRLEAEVLKNADKVVTVGETWRQELQTLAGRPVELITNGYDEEDVLPDGMVEPDKDFSLVHIGMMGGARNHEVFWEAVKELCDENDDFRQHVCVKLYGKVDEGVHESIRRNGLQEKVKWINYVPHSEVLRVQKSAYVLYLSVNNAPNAKGINTGKIFEYIGSGRPVLCIGPEDGDAAQILKSCGIGWQSGFNDKSKLKSNLLDLFAYYQSEMPTPRPIHPERFSRKGLTGLLAQKLDEIMIG